MSSGRTRRRPRLALKFTHIFVSATQRRLRAKRHRLQVNRDAISGGERTPRSPPEIAAIEPRDSQRVSGDFFWVAAKRRTRMG